MAEVTKKKADNAAKAREAKKAAKKTEPVIEEVLPPEPVIEEVKKEYVAPKVEVTENIKVTESLSDLRVEQMPGGKWQLLRGLKKVLCKGSKEKCEAYKNSIK